MGYINLKTNGNYDKIEHFILSILSERKKQNKDGFKSTKGIGVYLIQREINRIFNKNKISYNDLDVKLNNMMKEGLIYYENFHFFVIDKKGEIRLRFIKDELGKSLDRLIKKIY
ncbi:MAG TPA: hypothetical protein VK982_00730 [Bacteroidales bacterium]|nr:hypothetical protein [Bacteroidales bacterium]